MPISELLERIQEETESLENIYYGENVIAEAPAIIKMKGSEYHAMLTNSSMHLKKLAADQAHDASANGQDMPQKLSLAQIKL